MMHKMITFEMSRIVEANVKTEHTQACEEALMDTWKINYGVTSTGLKDALYQYIEKVLIKMYLKGTLDDLFVRNMEQQSQAPAFMYTSTHRVRPKLDDFYASIETFRQEMVANHRGWVASDH